ncbi:forkhead box protein D2-like [Clytia hemisphaerica]|uniref:Fork-head domain-containing protein n=1 Tax=Clytia hemisphaerica TaxID=252671 RepID=A0A7M5X359_9CNID|eukprot:TCONS_00019496-protein
MIMRPEPTKLRFDIQQQSHREDMKKPFCFDSITAEKQKQKSMAAEIEIIETSRDQVVKEKKMIDENAVKTRDTKVSESSSTRGSDDEGTTDGKPNHSYISLIANAILSSKEKRLVLSDIYQFVLDTQPYFRNKAGQGWRNSIRHNLSLNECFVKAGRSPNGKGHFWAINPANFDDFSKGDFRRRRAQRRARRAMAFGDLIEHFGPYWSSYQQYSSPRPTMASYTSHPVRYSPYYRPTSIRSPECKSPPYLVSSKRIEVNSKPIATSLPTPSPPPTATKKRGFDVESLLRDDKEIERPIPIKINKRPSSTDVSPPSFTGVASSYPYARLNLDYLNDKRYATPRFGATDLSTAASLYERRRIYGSTQRSHYLWDERYKLSMV